MFTLLNNNKKMFPDLNKLLAKQERLYYQNQCNANSIHLTYDYSQSFHLPYFIKQSGSFYFKVGLVVGKVKLTI